MSRDRVKPDSEPIAAPSVVSAFIELVEATGPAVGDTSLVRDVLLNRDLIPNATALISQRAGCAVRFITEDKLALQEQTPGERAEPVGVGDRLYGYLIAPTTAADISSHAGWLASWLRLRDELASWREESFRDPLPGAYNRRYFDLYMEKALERSRVSGRSVSILLFDIDNFKQFNDSHGHAFGDAVLCETVRLLTSVVRPTDKVCRIGGDEFVVIMDEPDGPRREGSSHPASVHDIAERFRRQLREHRFPTLGRHTPARLSVSGGLATCPQHGQTARGLLAHADKLAMESKRAGKNVFTYGDA